MNINQEVLFLSKTCLDSHDSSLKDHLPKDRHNFYLNIQRLFGHQRAVYVDQEQIDEHDISSKLAKYFYKECYIDPMIHRGINGIELKPDDVLHEVLFQNGTGARNNLFYLLGDVGTGKTSYINYIISERLSKFVKSRDIWFIRIDFEEYYKGTTEKDIIFNSKDILIYIIKKSLDIIVKNSEMLCKSDSCIISKLELHKIIDKYDKFKDTANEPSLKEIALCFADFVHSMRDENSGNERKLLLIFDNIDYILHANDRICFSPESKTLLKPLMKKVNEFVMQFFPNRDLGQLYSQILIVARKETYRFLTRIYSLSLAPAQTLYDLNPYAIQAPDFDAVLNARTKLLSMFSNMESNKGRKEVFKKMSRLIQSHIEKPFIHQSTKLIDHLKNISNFGLRELMTYFSIYGWVENNHFEEDHTGALVGPVSRFIDQYHVGVVAFILGEKCLFSQIESRFPNIYSVYSQKHEHAHTYWLKYLILKYIKTINSTTLNRILSIFHCNGQGYNKETIYECLGSLNQSDCSACLSVELTLDHRANDPTISSITVTSRGSWCIDNIFDRFLYLQLILDDYFLPIPSCLEEIFPRNEKEIIDYKYLTNLDGQQYNKFSIEMIQTKAKQVLNFINILDFSLEYEKIIYSNVFDNLGKEHKFQVPDVESIRQSVLVELNKINSSFSNKLSIDQIKIDVDKMKPKIEEQLNEIYSLS